LVWFHRNINAGGTFTHVFVEEEDDAVNEVHFNNFPHLQGDMAR
jgi:hypothetical protein